MFNKLSHILNNKFSRKDELSRQVEIARILDLCRGELKKKFPGEEVEVVSIKNHALLIRVNNSILASELRLQESSFMNKINSLVGKEKIKKIIYRF